MTQSEAPPSLWDSIHQAGYQFMAPLELQPRWDVPEEIAISVAVAGRSGHGLARDGEYPASIEGYLAAASEVIEAGACSVHLDFSMLGDLDRRFERDRSHAEVYQAVLEPLRDRFGWDFVANLNVLNGSTFDECLLPARSGLAEIAPCAAGHPDAFLIPAVTAMEECGVKPQITVHSSGEIELAKRKIIDTGIVSKPYYWIILYGLPFNTGNTLLSGTWVSNTQDMTRHLFLMVDQIKSIDPDSVITVCAAGRSSLYMTTLATMLGLNIRVGTEDTLWKYPNSDEPFRNNREMFEMARTIAGMLGRRPATGHEYRRMLGLPEKEPATVRAAG